MVREIAGFLRYSAGNIFTSRMMSSIHVGIEKAGNELGRVIIQKLSNAFQKIPDKKLRAGFKGLMSTLYDPIDKVKKIGKTAFKPLQLLGKTKVGKAIGGFGKLIGGFAAFPLGIIMAVFHLLDALGVLEPILQVVSALFDVFGGALMTALAPAFQELFAVLLSPEVINLITSLAQVLGAFLVPIIKAFAIALRPLLPLFNLLAELFSNELKPVMKVLGKVIGLLVVGAMIPFVLAIWAIGAAIAGLVDIVTGGWARGWEATTAWNNMLLPAIGQSLAAVPEVLAMQTGGIVTSPTLAVLAERGPEVVIPLEQSSDYGIGDNEEVVWALKENNDKLDMIYQAILLQNRRGLRR